MIRDRVMAGLGRARSSGKRLGRPRTTPFTLQRIRLALGEGRGVHETARLLTIVYMLRAKAYTIFLVALHIRDRH